MTANASVNAVDHDAVYRVYGELSARWLHAIECKRATVVGSGRDERGAYVRVQLTTPDAWQVGEGK